MKPVIIIAIAVVCSVVAVLVLQEIATYQSQVAFDEYQTELERQEAAKQQTQEPEPTLGDALEAAKQRILSDPNLDNVDGVDPALYNEEHYTIEITGLKDVYFVGEQYDFSYIISGYGYSCGGTKITFPDQNGEIVGIVSEPLCVADAPMREFVFDIPQEYGHVELKNPGTYTVTVTFDRPNQYFPTTASQEFRVMEK